MNRIAILVALTLPFLSTAGEPKATPEFNKATSPEVLHKSYQAMHRVTRKHEIGRSSLTITADCHDTSAAAAEALTQKEAAIRAEIENTLSHLVLAKGERTNYDLSAKAEPQANSPVALQFDLAQKKNRWINRCTGVGSDAPVRVKNVYTVSKTFTVWLANEKQLLNDLTQLVNRIEALSEQGSAGTKVTCAKSGDGNYQLGVTAATEKAAWAEVESEAKRLALEKKDHDFNKTEYNESWEGDGVFSKGPRYDLPSVSVTNVNGQWIGKFANDYSYTVHYKQSTETSHEKEPGQLTDKKSYMVHAEAQTDKGLYGTLTVNVRHSCQATKADAENSVTAVGAEILKGMRELNGGLDTETDRLEVKDAYGTEENPLQSYNQIVNDQYVSYYYNPCDLKTHEVVQRPDIKVWVGYQTLSITSRDLNGLGNIKAAWEKHYARELEDENQMVVTVSPVDGTAVLDVLQSMESTLEAQAFADFQKRGSEFKCDATKFSYACLTNPAQNNRYARDFSESAPAAAPGAAYSKAVSDVDASERGAKKFEGTFTLNYTVRRVLINHKR